MKHVFVALVLVTQVALAQTGASLDGVVAANFPGDLHDYCATNHVAENREQSYVQTTQGGINYVVAAYSDGEIGAVTLLEQTSSGYVVVQEVSKAITGTAPEVRLRDVDADGSPEAFVVFDTGKGGSDTWIYRIEDHHLRLISPTNKLGGSLVAFPHDVDFDGRGVIDLIEDEVTGTREQATTVHTHYVLKDGVYVAVEPLDFFDVFYREKGEPKTVTKTFAIPATAVQRSYKLAVLNGDASGASFRVASGSITLNGVVISPSSDFSESRAAWTIPVTLQEQNTIKVKLAGKPGGRIGIAIRHE